MQLVNIGVRFADQWENIGTGLKVEVFRLRNIRRDNQDAQACMREVFIEWEKGMKSPYTWENLAQVLCSDAINEGGVLEVMYKQLSV